jgi:aminomethyltransferase
MFETLQNTLTNDLTKVAPGRAQYTHLLADDGTVVDDIIVWWMGDNEFDVMPNASNTDGVTSALPGRDVTHERCVLAVQGPQARELLRRVDERFAAVPRFHTARVEERGHTIRVAGTGYTGEDGVELAIPNELATEYFERFVHAGIQPAGLGARDTLRLEAALPLYGHELSRSSTTLQAKLGWVLGWDKPTFRGRDAVWAEKQAGPTRQLTGVATDGRQPLRDGAEVFVEGRSVGTLSSGNVSPVLGHGIGMGLFEPGLELDTPCSVSLRGREIAGRICSLPFVRKAR